MRPPTELRLFVAVALEPDIRARVDEAARQLRRGVSERLKAGGSGGNPMKWVATENLHLTLKFLGETPLHIYEDIDAALRAASAKGEPFAFTVGGAGAFPGVGRPRVLWLGVQVPDKPVRRLRHALDDEFSRLGFARETRPFSPHLTVARVRDIAPADEVRLVGEAVQRARIGELGRQEVGSIALVRSELFSTGPRYTELATYELGTGRASYPPAESIADTPIDAEAGEARAAGSS